MGHLRTAHQGLSEAAEDFLKAVYLLQQQQDPVRTSALAERLDIAAPSATEMAQKLVKANLVTHEPYHGVRLTPDGRRIALKIVRYHRLMELFLVRVLGYGWDEVDEEAERLEHVMSSRLAERTAEYLGHPHYDPHGDLIPSPESDADRRDLTPLSSWPPGKKGIVTRLRDQTPDLLRYLAQKGLVIGALAEVQACDPLDGLLTLQVDGIEQVIGPHVAQCVFMSEH